MIYPWHVTAAAIAASFAIVVAMAFAAVWWGDRSAAREYRERCRRLSERPARHVLDVPHRKDGTPLLPHSLDNSGPFSGVRLSGPYRRRR